MANLLQPDLLQAYVQLLAQQSEGSASTTGGDAETNYCSTSFAQALTANSSLLHQVVTSNYLVTLYLHDTCTSSYIHVHVCSVMS